ncbi:MAG: PIN domain-containing protein [Cyanobacteria bacterium]|jgi:predicted nucleic acid-binding protein|nr:PIN domain-containing protein [Cyanobacteriota bacterium]
MSKISYIDSGVLINAFRGDSQVSLQALLILDEPDRQFASSPFVQLETLPKSIYQRQITEQDFYQTFFDNVKHWANDIVSIVPQAQTIAGKYGIAGMDALHIAAALSIGAEEFITTEKKTKPMFRITELKMISIAIS